MSMATEKGQSLSQRLGPMQNELGKVCFVKRLRQHTSLLNSRDNDGDLNGRMSRLSPGASSGIGAAIAVDFARCGATIVIAYYSDRPEEIRSRQKVTGPLAYLLGTGAMGKSAEWMISGEFSLRPRSNDLDD